MMRKILALSLALLSELTFVMRASAGSVDALRIASASADWHIRENAFRAFCAAPDGQELCDSNGGHSASVGEAGKVLINLLNREGLLIDRASFVSEQWSNYFADLIHAVSNLHDTRAAPVLITPSVLESGRVATSGLAQLGQPAADLMLKAIDTEARSQDANVALYKTSLFIALEEMAAAEPSLAAATMTSVKSHLLKASYDPEGHVREAALRGLIHLRGDDVQSRLREMSVSDSWVNHKGTFPLREEALAALRSESHE